MPITETASDRPSAEMLPEQDRQARSAVERSASEMHACNRTRPIDLFSHFGLLIKRVPLQDGQGAIL